MAFTHAGSARADGSSGPVDTGSHGIAINSGDLVVCYVNINGTGSLTPDDAGWQTPADEIPSGESSRHALYWRVAGGAEPANYSWTMGSSSNWQVIIKVFPSTTDAVVDAAINTDIKTAKTTNVPCGAYDGQVIAADAVAVAFGGKDNRRASTEAYTTANNSYGNVVGIVRNSMTAGSHRIYGGTGETGSGNVTMTTDDSNDGQNDYAYSMHMSWVEGAAAVDLIPTPLTHSFATQRAANY